jgi:hypothetical protein
MTRNLELLQLQLRVADKQNSAETVSLLATVLSFVEQWSASVLAVAAWKEGPHRGSQAYEDRYIHALCECVLWYVCDRHSVCA